MKTKFNLSTIIKRAHEMFKNRLIASETFADCLCYVWKMAKAYAQNGKVSYMHGVENAMSAMAVDMDATLVNYYANAPKGTYFGD